ncbi:hypothetical protein [Marivirga sp.]|uniref:hypothetical protein n=1 Tax=Marivirga sp. TaxID=2018662 RepID=UPI002D7EFEDE|nr:hypothetical protein [Marivirga sp.]HET8860585.1 hypothetical protein [Marivirga sp.]
MKNITLFLISVFIVSCSTQKVLKTDTQQDIDLSGRWNQTDAEIASSDLFNSLLASSWLKGYQAQNGLKPKIEILNFKSNFEDGGDDARMFFISYMKENSAFELIERKGRKVSDFQLSGNILAEEFLTENQNYIDYTFKTQIRELSGEIMWEETTVVKKYIKD